MARLTLTSNNMVSIDTKPAHNLIYCINGWKESKSYFLSFGFTQEELKQMETGEEIVRGDNVFSIAIE